MARGLIVHSPLLFQNQRTRESSIAINPEWSMLEEVEFTRLSKLSLNVDEPETLFVVLFPLSYPEPLSSASMS
jgi:hypothetical protein